VRRRITTSTGPGELVAALRGRCPRPRFRCHSPRSNSVHQDHWPRGPSNTATNLTAVVVAAMASAPPNQRPGIHAGLTSRRACRGHFPEPGSPRTPSPRLPHRQDGEQVKGTRGSCRQQPSPASPPASNQVGAPAPQPWPENRPTVAIEKADAASVDAILLAKQFRRKGWAISGSLIQGHP